MILDAAILGNGNIIAIVGALISFLLASMMVLMGHIWNQRVAMFNDEKDSLSDLSRSFYKFRTEMLLLRSHIDVELGVYKKPGNIRQNMNELSSEMREKFKTVDQNEKDIIKLKAIR